MRLLFLGNSLTYTHDVPRLVARLARAAGRLEPAIVSRAEPNYALEDHWNDGVARSVLRSGNFRYVIMQQGPSTLPESRLDLIHWTKRWSDEARVAGTTPAMYGVWPPRGGNLDAGIVNYADAATNAATVLFPVAAVWREAWAADPSLPLYGPDGFHPGAHGAWLAAVVITSVLFDLSPHTLNNLYPESISPYQEATMKAAAARILSAGT